MRLLRKSGDVPKRSLWQRVKDIAMMDVAVLARGGVSAGSLEQLEQILLEADFGVPVTLRLVAEVERLAKRGQVKTEAEFHKALAQASRRRSERATATCVSTRVGVRADGDSRGRRQRRRQDDVHRQARRAVSRGAAARDGRRRRHVSRRRDRSVARVGRAHGSGVHWRAQRARTRPPSRSMRSTRRSRASVTC